MWPLQSNVSRLVLDKVLEYRFCNPRTCYCDDISWELDTEFETTNLYLESMSINEAWSDYVQTLKEEDEPRLVWWRRPKRSSYKLGWTLQLSTETIKSRRRSCLSWVFNRVPGATLWWVLGRVGCPEKFVDLVRQFHDEHHLIMELANGTDAAWQQHYKRIYSYKWALSRDA